MGGGINKFGYHNYETFGGENEIYSLVKAARHQRYFNYHFSRGQYENSVIRDGLNPAKERMLDRVNVINTKDYIVISGVKAGRDKEVVVNELLKGLKNVPIVKSTNLKSQLIRALNRNELNRPKGQRVKYSIAKEDITRRGQHGFEVIGARYYFDIYLKKPKR